MTRASESVRYETSSSVVEGVTAAASPPPVTEAAKPSGVPETVGVAACARAAKPAARMGAECILVIVWSVCEKSELGDPEKERLQQRRRSYSETCEA